MSLLIAVATYVLVANPATYKTTRGLLGNWVASADGAANLGGLFLHAFVYLFLTGLLLNLFVPQSSGFLGMGTSYAGSLMRGTACSNNTVCQSGQCQMGKCA
jgi:hypothetical protein